MIVTDSVFAKELIVNKITPGSSSATGLQFTQLSGTSFINIDSTNGFVGIGDGTSQTAPAATLHLGRGAAAPVFRIDRTSTAYISFSPPSGTVQQGFWQANGTNSCMGIVTLASGNFAVGDITFGVALPNSPAMVIKNSNGFIGLGVAANVTDMLTLSGGNISVSGGGMSATGRISGGTIMAGNGFTGTGVFTNLTISGGIVIAAS